MISEILNIQSSICKYNRNAHKFQYADMFWYILNSKWIIYISLEQKLDSWSHHSKDLILISALSAGNQYKDNDETTVALLQVWSFITPFRGQFYYRLFFLVNQNQLTP